MQPDDHAAGQHYGMPAIFRADLSLSLGALASLSGQAFVSSWLKHCEMNLGLAADYANAPERKHILAAPDLAALHDIAARAERRRIAVVFIPRASYAVAPDPEFAALGLGPLSKTDWNALTRGLKQILGAMPRFEPPTPRLQVDYGDMVLVPRTPTTAMCEAASEAMRDHREASGAEWIEVSKREETCIRWKAMLAKWEGVPNPTQQGSDAGVRN